MFKKKPLDLDPRILKRLFRQENEVQVMVYWEDHYEVLVALLLLEEDQKVIQEALVLLAESLNKREKYTWTAFIYHKVFRLKNRFQGSRSPLINTMKFELGKGLHFSREYAAAKRLFDDLNREPDFDHSLYEDWYDHSMVSSKREQYLDSNAFLLLLSKFLFSLLFLVLVLIGFETLYSSIIYFICAMGLQFSYYWEKASSLFGTFRKHKKEVKKLKSWFFVEGSLLLGLVWFLLHDLEINIAEASSLVIAFWLGSLLFNTIFLKTMKKRITFLESI